MKIEYDSVRDSLYIWFGIPGKKAARTETVVPGVHADLDQQGRLIGIEVLDASEVMRQRVQFEVMLGPSQPEALPTRCHPGTKPTFPVSNECTRNSQGSENGG